jgi:hypothetical protein
VQRIDAVLRSRHRHELAVHVADLPSPAPRTSTRPFISPHQRVGLVVVAAAVVLAAVLVQALAGLWELWPLAVLTVALAQSRFVGTIRPSGNRLSELPPAVTRVPS